MEAVLTTKPERQVTFADELAFTKIKQILQVLSRGNHFTQGYLDIQALWAKGFMMLSERIRFGGPPLMAHHLMSLNLSRVAGNRIGGGDAAERRAHLVHGHFKIRKTTRTPEGADLF